MNSLKERYKMAKLKKTFDKELMYKKIMPTNLKKEQETSIIANEDSNGVVVEQKDKIINEKETAIFKNKELNFIIGEKSEIILYNVMEKLVLDKLDITLKKMNCCRCDRCKEDIIALALNNLKPMYIVASKDEINNKINELDKGLEVTTAVLKAVLSVRKSPRH
jgi:hypothetical protein